jgi:hypothetical protein
MIQLRINNTNNYKDFKLKDEMNPFCVFDFIFIFLFKTKKNVIKKKKKKEKIIKHKNIYFSFLVFSDYSLLLLFSHLKKMK